MDRTHFGEVERLAYLSQYRDLHGEMPSRFLDVEVWDEYGEGHWAQARYLVHGWDDVMWTDDLEQAMAYFTDEMKKSALAERSGGSPPV